jgi:hypothetical protein
LAYIDGMGDLSDQNHSAYMQDLGDGKLTDGSWVAYHDGKLIATAETYNKLFNLIKGREGGSYVHQVGVTETAVLDTPFLD